MASINLKSQKTQAIFLAAIAAVIGVVAKLALTGGELLPGIDGAYYWVQVRSVLDDFTLAFDDLPLVFWAQALIALVVGDIPLGVRISDALLPALSAIPIYLMLKKSKSVWLPAVAILVVLLNPIQLYFFTGDFLKNSAAIPVVFFIAWILYNWDNAPKKRSVIYLLLCLGVLALAHFGTLLMALMIVFVWLLAQLRNKSLKFWLVGSGLSLITAGAVLAGLAWLVPARFTRLIEFVTQPETVFAVPAGLMLLGGRTDYPMVFAMITGQLGALALGFWAYKIRKNLNDSQLSLVVASLVSAFVLSSPFIGMEWANRLIAMAFVPLTVAAIIVWNASKTKAPKVVIGALAAITLIVSAIFGFVGIKQSMISTNQYQDLVKFSEEYEIPENSIVVAPHGIEFLVAWHEGSFVLQESSYEDEDLSAYDSVYYLQSTGQKEMPGGTPPTGDKPPMDSDKAPMAGDKAPPGGTPPSDGKPPMAGDKAPPGGTPPSDGKPPMGGTPSMGGGKGTAVIDGEQVYKNDSYTLLKVR